MCVAVVIISFGLYYEDSMHIISLSDTSLVQTDTVGIRNKQNAANSRRIQNQLTQAIPTDGTPISTETAPPGPAPYLNTDNVSEYTDKRVITSPSHGQVFVLGGDVSVQWDPELIDVSTATLIRTDANNSPVMQIYHRNRLDDRATQQAKFTYTLPNNLTVYPGTYRIQVSDYSGRNTFTSDEFRIDSPVPLVQRSTVPYRINSVLSTQASYREGDIMKLNVEATEGDGTFADPAKGFNVQARLYNIDNSGVWSGNAVYDLNSNVWHLAIPISKDTYRVGFTVYCSRLSLDSYCAQKYDPNMQLSNYVNFTISQ